MADAAAWGVTGGFSDAAGHWHDTPPPTAAAILAAMGAPGGDPPGAGPVVTFRLDGPPPSLPAGRLTLEGGASLQVEGLLPAGLPPGYHRLDTDAGEALAVIASPGRCPLPGRRAWGFAAQLYASRSRESWGIGDLADLRRLGRWSAGLGAGIVAISPLHATRPAGPQQASPYFAGSRCFANPLYIAVEDVPGAERVPAVEAAAAAGRALNAERRIDRDRVWGLKSAALEAVAAAGVDDEALAMYRYERGETLELFATFCALSELHGPRWQQWPADCRHPAASGTRAFASSPRGGARVRYHAWLQWLADRQLAAAAAEIGVVQDLAVGVDPEGADAWIWQDTFAPGMTVGAPPDEFNTQGQDWGLAPFDPWRLRDRGYGPFVESVRAGLRHSAGLRVDHVMGLFRLFWIPAGASPATGGYVRYPHEDLLNILVLEAHRAGSFIVGEDLGTVEEDARRELAGRDVLSYRLWWFEPVRPGGWPEKALGAVTTHDLPTVAGVLSGSDLEAQRAAGMHPNEESSAALRDRLLCWTGYDGSAPPAAVIEKVHAELASAPCLVVCATLDDALAVEERPNMPGTVDEWPNWCLALPAPLEELETLPLPRGLAAALGRRPP